jgi:hypothetical protein
VIAVAMTQRSPAVLAALELCRALEGHGISADAHPGEHVAALSVSYGLVVRCEYGPAGLHYRWWTGRLSSLTGRRVYTWCRSSAPQTAARRIAVRYGEVESTRGGEGLIRG